MRKVTKVIFSLAFFLFLFIVSFHYNALFYNENHNLMVKKIDIGKFDDINLPEITLCSDSSYVSHNGDVKYNGSSEFIINLVKDGYYLYYCDDKNDYAILGGGFSLFEYRFFSKESEVFSVQIINLSRSVFLKRDMIYKSHDKISSFKNFIMFNNGVFVLEGDKIIFYDESFVEKNKFDLINSEKFRFLGSDDEVVLLEGPLNGLGYISDIKKCDLSGCKMYDELNVHKPNLVYPAEKGFYFVSGNKKCIRRIYRADTMDIFCAKTPLFIHGVSPSRKSIVVSDWVEDESTETVGIFNLFTLTFSGGDEK